MTAKVTRLNEPSQAVIDRFNELARQVAYRAVERKAKEQKLTQTAVPNHDADNHDAEK